jgi:hypothetical protein
MAKPETVTTAPVAPEKLPIKPVSVVLNAANHANKEWIVHVDDTLTLQDVTVDRPDLWRAVQGNRDKALSEGDAVQLRWHDQIAFTHVDFADRDEVVFLKPTVHRRRERDRVFWSDANYEVKSVQGAWTYFRKKDGQRMSTATWPTPEAAKAACVREQAPARM